MTDAASPVVETRDGRTIVDLAHPDFSQDQHV